MPRLSLIFVLTLVLTGCTKAGSIKTVPADPISQFLHEFTNRAGSFPYHVASTNTSASSEDILANISKVEGAHQYPFISNFNIIEIRTIHPDEQPNVFTQMSNVVALVETERGRKIIHLRLDERATNIWTGTNICWWYHVYESN